MGDLTGPGGRGLSSVLDLRSPGGRRELAWLNLAPGGTVSLEGALDPDRRLAIEVQAGDQLEWSVMAQTSSIPTALIEWTITEVSGDRVWIAARDLAREPLEPDRNGSHADGYGHAEVWSFRESGDVSRPGVEPSRRNSVWTSWRQTLQSIDGKASDRSLIQSRARDLEKALGDFGRERSNVTNGGPNGVQRGIQSELLRLRAEDARWVNSIDGRVELWPNRARSTVAFAQVSPGSLGPVKTNSALAGRLRPVLRFAGNETMEVAMTVPPRGSLFAVFRVADPAAGGQRLIGWEDSNGGRHGIGLMPTPGGGLHAILRKDGANGDIVAPARTNAVLQMVTVIWGGPGVSVHRDGVAVGMNTSLDSVSSDPEINTLRIGGPGSGNASRFQGDLAELRVYGWPLDDEARLRVEKELSDAWVSPDGPGVIPPSDITLAFEELCSPRGPFWLEASDREALADPTELTSKITTLQSELAALKISIPATLPQAVVVQDGGPAKTKHEGFKDAAVYLRGNPKTPGKIVARGFPKTLAGNHQNPIRDGSGRLQLADWIASASNPLTARVAVNRMWQHHFGDGIVRTSTNFGGRGERPTHPELLDYLASCFIESGWSMKSMHRLMMLTAVYQQSSQASPETLAADPENRLWGRMNRTRLDAESLRDSLLTVAGRLDATRGGAGFQELGLLRRSVYLMSVRTGVKSGFASVFDSPDCGAIVEKRSVSTVAPQALFLLNDSFTIEQARALAHRVVGDDEISRTQDWIQAAYRLVFARPPTAEELTIGLELLRGHDLTERFERYCQLLLCSNEFVYLD